MFGSLKKLFGGEEKEEKIIAAPVNGTAIPMSQVSDPTFSQEILGKGTAVIPSDGRVVAPADGLVTMVFDTKHAIDKIKEAGYDVTTPVIICNTPQFPKMECVNGMEVKAGETAIIKL